MISFDQFTRGADLYFTNEVLPKLPDNKKFVAAFGVALFLKGLDKQPMLQSLGLVKDGLVDVESAYAAAKSAANAAPLTLDLPVVGRMVFNGNDIDQLYRLIMGG